MQYQSDYILRLIEQMGSLLRRALELVGVGNTQDAYGLSEEALSLALNVDPELVRRLSPTSLVSLLELQNMDEPVLALIADALDVEARALELEGDVAEAELRSAQSAAVRCMHDPNRAN